MNKDAISFFEYLIGAHGHRHFYLFNIPFLPGTFVEPKPAVLDPTVTCGLNAMKGLYYGRKTYDVRAMGGRQSHRRNTLAAVAAFEAAPWSI